MHEIANADHETVLLVGRHLDEVGIDLLDRRRRGEPVDASDRLSGRLVGLWYEVQVVDLAVELVDAAQVS